MYRPITLSNLIKNIAHLKIIIILSQKPKTTIAVASLFNIIGLKAKIKVFTELCWFEIAFL